MRKLEEKNFNLASSESEYKFINRVARLLRRNDFKIEMTRSSPWDLKASKDDMILFVECKRYADLNKRKISLAKPMGGKHA
jgi:hypothetical protein